MLKEVSDKHVKAFEELDLFVFLMQFEGHLNNFHICNLPAVHGHHLILIVSLAGVKVRDLHGVSFDITYAMVREQVDGVGSRV